MLDEPTASLDANETQRLFRILRDLKARGLAIVFITHFLDQVYQIADRITVLRNGRRVGSGATAEIPMLRLVSMMIGHELERAEHRTAVLDAGSKGETIIVAKGVGRRRVMARSTSSFASARWWGWRACSARGGPKP